MRRPAPEPKSPEFVSFKELAKNLLAVPKKEIDEQKARYDKERQHKDEKRTK